MAHILIAEHNEATAKYLMTTLKKAGHSVVVADNCLDAWKLSNNEMFDVLMVDVVMPGIDGFILAQRMLQDCPNVQIIFITGFAGIAMDTHATPSYAPAPITTRPFHLSEIAGRIRYMMGMGSLPLKPSALMSSDGSVIYADFGRKSDVAQQQQLMT